MIAGRYPKSHPEISEGYTHRPAPIRGCDIWEKISDKIRSEISKRDPGRPHMPERQRRVGVPHYMEVEHAYKPFHKLKWPEAEKLLPSIY